MIETKHHSIITRHEHRLKRNWTVVEHLHKKTIKKQSTLDQQFIFLLTHQLLPCHLNVYVVNAQSNDKYTTLNNRLNAHMHRKLKIVPSAQRVPVVRRTRQPSMFFRDVTDTNQSDLHSGHQQLCFTRNYMGAWRIWRRPPSSSLLLDWSCRRTRRRRSYIKLIIYKWSQCVTILILTSWFGKLTISMLCKRFIISYPKWSWTFNCMLLLYRKILHIESSNIEIGASACLTMLWITLNILYNS